MKIHSEPKLNYDDVLLVPQYSEIETRSSVDISSYLTPNIKLNIPVVISNMDTVVNTDVAREAYLMGSAAILHRYAKPQEVIDWVKYLKTQSVYPIIPSIGTCNDQIELGKELFSEYKVDAVCVDVAHGDHKIVLNVIEKLRHRSDKMEIIAGNIATVEGARRLINAGASTVKVGIGPSSVCLTRNQTGAGYPQLSAIMEIAPIAHELGATVIADGGVREIGDCVKAIAGGADTVMVGRLFAGSKEIGKSIYRGMAGADAQNEFKGFARNIEGKTIQIEQQNRSIKDILQTFKEAMQSGYSYLNSRNTQQLRDKAEFVIIK